MALPNMCRPRELPAVMDIVCIGAVQYGSHQPYVVMEHLKCN